jgi:hypothetical protein
MSMMACLRRHGVVLAGVNALLDAPWFDVLKFDPGSTTLML